MQYDSNNVFAKILRGEIACNKIYENDYALAFDDAKPLAPVHILVIPKGPYVSFNDFMVGANDNEINGFFKAVREVAKIMGMEEKGYRLITNYGKDGGQTVFHYHMHVLGGTELDGLMSI